MENGYKVAGVLNLNDKIPDFTLPVFSKNNKNYIGILDETGIRYIGFTEVSEGLMKKVKLLSEFKKQTFSTNWDHYSTLDEAIISFSLDKDSVAIFTLDRALAFFQGEYESTDESFKTSIYETVKEIEEGKKYLKELNN